MANENPRMPANPAPITSAQPGGGFCMKVELVWGVFRRLFLRAFFRGYVRTMAGKRQGTCPNCQHDIIDARDLKYYRNVCGYWFRDEDNPYLWRSGIGLARMGLAEVILFSLLFMTIMAPIIYLMAAVHWLFLILLVPVIVVWSLVLYFFRDPDRTIPPDVDCLLSPADGHVTDVGIVSEPGFPGNRAFRIGIFLSIFDVHVNRAPRAGKVVQLRYFPGSFLDARHPECGVRNEQMWIDIEEFESQRPVRVKQISGAIARRIVCWLKQGEAVKAGSRFGMIKFGSRTEVYVPATEQLDVQVKVGDAVKGGSTVLARFKEFNLEC